MDLKLLNIETPEPVEEYAEKNEENNGYIGWLTPYIDDLVLHIYAYRRRKNKPTDLREVIRITPSKEGMIQRDMYLTAMCGWRVIYRPQNKKSVSWYSYVYYDIDESEFGKWQWIDKCGIFYHILNPEVIGRTRYKYSGYSNKLKIGLIEYLRLWIENPEVEFFGKAGITPSKALIKKAKKDRNFITWMRRFDNIDDFNTQAIIYAYTHKKTPEEACVELDERNRATAWARGYFRTGDFGLTMKDIRRIYAYAFKNGIGAASYRDYLQALAGLEYDLKDTKNLLPQDFRRMHDLRTNQWSSKKKKISNKEFMEAAAKYKIYEAEGQNFIIRIPNFVEDLKNEGRELGHCVGSMGYDTKMKNGVSFIAFLRKADNPEKPYVTIEYGIGENRVLQVYGKNDSKPEPDALAFVKTWEKECRKKRKT